MASSTFKTVVSRLRSAVRRRVKAGATTVSALDLRGVQRKQATSSTRGAAVRRAFTDLVDEGLLTPTDETVYNTDTHHSVTVYRVA